MHGRTWHVAYVHVYLQLAELGSTQRGGYELRACAFQSCEKAVPTDSTYFNVVYICICILNDSYISHYWVVVINVLALACTARPVYVCCWYRRIANAGLNLTRYPASVARYRMMRHARGHENPRRSVIYASLLLALDWTKCFYQLPRTTRMQETCSQHCQSQCQCTFMWQIIDHKKISNTPKSSGL